MARTAVAGYGSAVSGCTNCGSKTGCDDRKGSMFERIDDAMARLYPDRRWRAPAPTARGVRDATDDAAALADELADALNAATFVRTATPTDSAFIYVLCQGRPPCAVPVRDGDLPIPDEWQTLPAGQPIEERYLRIALATQLPFAAVQEVAVDVTIEPDGVLIRERPSAGVYSAPLLPRMQRLVATLPAYGRLNIDMGEISGPPADFDAGEWPGLYAGTPAIVNYLFFAAPATMAITTWIPRA